MSSNEQRQKNVSLMIERYVALSDRQKHDLFLYLVGFYASEGPKDFTTVVSDFLPALESGFFEPEKVPTFTYEVTLVEFAMQIGIMTQQGKLNLIDEPDLPGVLARWSRMFHRQHISTDWELVNHEEAVTHFIEQHKYPHWAAEDWV